MIVKHILNRNFHLTTFHLITLAVLSSPLLLAGCGGGGGSDSGEVANTVTIPTDSTLNLYCPNVGIASEECVLFDPDNPYANSAITDENKWDLAKASPSTKSDFYLWATALAKNPTGENQYYTAVALQKLYSQSGSELSREQAKKAYRSMLDNYYDSVTYYEGSPQLDFIPDRDFFYSDWSSGSADAGWNGGHTSATDYSPVWYVPAGEGWGAPTACLAFYGFTAGYLANYQNMVFKVKDLPTNSITIKYASGGGPEKELSFDLARYATDIEGTTGWKQVTIPLNEFESLSAFTEFGIHTGYSNGGNFTITDIGYTGDATGNGLVNDVDNDGLVALYRSGSQLLSLDLRNLAGANLYSPSGGLSQLYASQAESTSALTSWGYTYNSSTSKLQRIQ